jgi:sRNA-binding protein
MRRIVLVIVVVAVVGVALYLLLRPKRAPVRPRSSTAMTDTTGGTQTVRSSGSRTARTGQVVGKLRASTAAERRAEAKKIRAAERERKKELRRQEREKRRMLRRSASRRGRRKSRKGEGYYVLKAVVAVGSDSYALIDGRKVQAGDFVLGRKIIEIGQDRIEIEAFGKRSTVRVGESLMPSSYTPARR